MDREEAEKKLKAIFGLEYFYNEQWKAINKILQGERVLMIERTGFGKSLCYQFPATQFSRITIVFSPLIALMRDQVQSLKNKGIAAGCINSEQTQEENNQTIEKALKNELKIIYIAPERQENAIWLEAAQQMNISMIVVDEAHTISVWGHDFRPAFKLIVRLVKLLPVHCPVLATTATATKRVQKDIEQQIGGNLTVIRGNLCRNNFKLFVIKTKSEDEKMLWIAKYVNNMPGMGLIYTGTRSNSEIYSNWLNFLGINAVYYHAGLDENQRQKIEHGLRENKYKVIASTNALGMGIDKPDIRFIIHTQIPASPIHYYQEIGRAGRDGKDTYIILFYNEQKNSDGIAEDYKLPKSFIDSARPTVEQYLRVIDCLKEKPFTQKQIMQETNLKQTQVRTITADLTEQGITKKRDNVFEYQYNAMQLDTKSFEELRKLKLKDLDAMINYVYTDEPRMKYLCDFLDDDTTEITFNNCDNTKYKKRQPPEDDKLKTKLQEFRGNYFPVIDTTVNGTNVVNGVASSYYGVSNVGKIIHKCKYENGGDFPNNLIELTLKAFRKMFKDEKFDLILYVPPTRSGDLVKNFAHKIAVHLNIPISDGLFKTRQTKEQKIFQNSYCKKDNVIDAFSYRNPQGIEGKRILLIDDIFDSGATIKEIGKMLSNMGAQNITPLVIAKTVGGTL